MDSFFANKKGIPFPSKSLIGRTTGAKFPLSFYFEDEETFKRMKIFFGDKTSRPSVGKLLQIVADFEKRAKDDG